MGYSSTSFSSGWDDAGRGGEVLVATRPASIERVRHSLASGWALDPATSGLGMFQADGDLVGELPCPLDPDHDGPLADGLRHTGRRRQRERPPEAVCLLVAAEGLYDLAGATYFHLT